MTKAWEKRVAEGRPHHGLGADDYFPGNVQHLVSPIVGNMRLIMADGKMPTPSDIEHWVDRLAFVLEIAQEEDGLRRNDESAQRKRG